jgi:hypothetical protein
MNPLITIAISRPVSGIVRKSQIIDKPSSLTAAPVEGKDLGAAPAPRADAG